MRLTFQRVEKQNLKFWATLSQHLVKKHQTQHDDNGQQNKTTPIKIKMEIKRVVKH